MYGAVVLAATRNGAAGLVLKANRRTRIGREGVADEQEGISHHPDKIESETFKIPTSIA